MGLLDIFKKSGGTTQLMRLPTGSFTVDSHGHVVASTLPQAFPAHCVKEIAQQVLNAFRNAQVAETPLNEFIIEYGSLKIKAKELRGGAMIFLAPKTLGR